MEKLLIAHCIASMDKNAGGTTTALFDILKEQSNFVDLELYTLNSANQISIPLNNFELYSENASFLDYSAALKEKFLSSKADLFHGHALWNLPIHQMCSHAREKKIPYLISVHGMLEPWSIQQSRLKKSVAMNLYQRKDIRRATCIHATADLEAQNIRKLGFKNPIAIIPNGIDISMYPMKNKNIMKTKRKILFLSRIHRKKGIEILIDAWSQLSSELRMNWEIEIAGNGSIEYINILNNKITQLGLQQEIFISGPHFGQQKINTYHSADLFVLPTYSENFGMVIAEALSCGIPVITTKGTPWKDLEDFKVGAWIEIGVDALRNTLEQFLLKTTEELEEMGQRGRNLVQEKYSIESVGKKFIELYTWIIDKNIEKPKYVRI